MTSLDERTHLLSGKDQIDFDHKHLKRLDAVLHTQDICQRVSFVAIFFKRLRSVCVDEDKPFLCHLPRLFRQVWPNTLLKVNR